MTESQLKKAARMSWIERLLLGKNAARIAKEAEERLAVAEKDLEKERLNFHEMRGRLLAAIDHDSKRLRPVSLPDIEEYDARK